MNNRHIRINAHMILGLAILMAGVLFTLNNFDIVEPRILRSFWPLLIMLIGLAVIFQAGSYSGRIAGGIIVFIGLMLLLRTLGLVRFYFHDVWPVILILIGAIIMLKAFDPKRLNHFRDGKLVSSDSDQRVNLFAMFAGYNRQNNSQDFSGGSITAIMGGCEIDFRNASIESGNAIIDVFAFWGGIDIKVPADWTVSIQGTPILGGLDDKTKPIDPTSKKRLTIKGSVIMGGVTVTN